MNKFLAIATCAISLTPTAVAQTYFTSPKGLDSTEGNTVFYASTNRRYMGIDASNQGSVAVIKTFAMRRNTSSASTAGASTVDITLTLGETNMAAVYSEFDRNFSVSRTLVFPKQQVNWPDWSATTPSPAPFDLIVPLNASFLYLGQNSLVWDLIMENGTNTGNQFDREFTFYTTGSRASLSAGCAGFTLTSTFESNGPALTKYGMRLKSGVTGAPANAPVNLSLALTDADATVPGFCAKLHAIPLAIVPLGVSTGTGQIYSCYFNTPYDASLNGATLYSQAFSTAGGALSLSSGNSSLMPTNTATTGDDACYLWCSLTTVPNNGTVFTGGSIVVQYGT